MASVLDCATPLTSIHLTPIHLIPIHLAPIHLIPTHLTTFCLTYILVIIHHQKVCDVDMSHSVNVISKDCV